MQTLAPPRQSRKSQRTRARILDEAMRLFAEVGYATASNPAIAEASGLTRGAMLYHFATREALVEAAIAHIDAARAALFEEAAQPAPGADAVEHAIDAYWSLLKTRPFRAFAELESAAQTDPMLRERLAAAQASFDRAQVGDQFISMAIAGADPRFQTSRDLARFLLEGLSRGALTYDAATRTERLLKVLKRAVRMLNRKGAVQELWPD